MSDKNNIGRRAFLRAHPEPPWTCAHCGKLIQLKGRSKISLIVHHVDGDRRNNQLHNLQPMHRGCHQVHHQLGRKRPDWVVEKVAAAQRGKPHGPMPEATRSKISATMKGYKQAPDHASNRPKCPPGCQCNRHKPSWNAGRKVTSCSPCPPSCTCGKHNKRAALSALADRHAG